MLRDVILIHGPNTGAERAGTFRTGLLRVRRGSAPTIEVAKLKPKELHAETKNPALVAWSYPFKTKLIKPILRKPTAKADEKAKKKADTGPAWGLDAIGALNSTMTGSGVVVAVLDTGIQNDHPAFLGVKLTEKDFSGEGDGDKDGHGTHCAGTIFGRDVGGRRIGVARGVEKALIGKVLGKNGGDTGMLVKGMQWAQDEGAKVISMSLGYDFPGQVAELIDKYDLPPDIASSVALEAFRSNLRLFDSVMGLLRNTAAANGDDGVVIVAASGNESRLDENPNWRVNVSLPAAADGMLAVGAVGQGASKYSLATFSNSLPALVAPGVAILSAKRKGGLAELDGTSMACPHVAGAAALWWQKLRETGGATARGVLAKLEGTADPSVLLGTIRPEDRGQGMVRCP